MDVHLPNTVKLWITEFYAPEIEDRGAYCFCPVCHSVLLSETLTLLITFEQCRVSARALIFHMSIPCDKTFPWTPLFFTL